MTAVRRTTTRKKATARKGKARKSAAKAPGGRKKAPRATRATKKAKSPIEKLEEQLPPTLAQFSRRVRARLTQLEAKIEEAEVRTRRGWTKLLREGSHQLGLFEARGELQWRKLTLQARRDVVKLLQRLEKALRPPDTDSPTPTEQAAKGTVVKKAARKKAARSEVTAQRATPKSGAPAETETPEVVTERGEQSFEDAFASEPAAVEDDDYEEEPDEAFPSDAAEDEDLEELLKSGF